MPRHRRSSGAFHHPARTLALRAFCLATVCFGAGGAASCDRARIDLETLRGGLDGAVTGVPGGGARYFPGDSWMYQDISSAPVHARSDEMTAWVGANGGWTEGVLRIDFNLTIVNAGPEAAERTFEPSAGFYSPDCDQAPIPLPTGGALQGESGYECNGGGECHLIVVERSRGLLFEQWRANVTASRFEGGCLARWDMGRVYPPEGRGEQCTSADAAGLPMAPLLATVEEVAAGSVEHALRFYVLSNGIASDNYVRPATHGGAATGSPKGPMYGARWRLRSDFDMTRLPGKGARSIARALQRYGMVLVGNGSLSVFAASDRFSSQRWSDWLSADSLGALRATDFDVVDTGEPIPLTYACVRTD